MSFVDQLYFFFNQIPPYPSQATLEQKMQDQANLDSFKTQTINSLLDTLYLWYILRQFRIIST